jgi:hypothetical protein
MSVNTLLILGYEAIFGRPLELGIREFLEPTVGFALRKR